MLTILFIGIISISNNATRFDSLRTSLFICSSVSDQINAEVENDHVWATDGPDAILYGLAPNYGFIILIF